jgi:hypothetical protein
MQEDAVARPSIFESLTEMPSSGPCSGAACCQLTEQPTYKAAPLQALAARARRAFTETSRLYPSRSSLSAAPKYRRVSLGSIDSSDSDSTESSAARPHNHAPSLAAS